MDLFIKGLDIINGEQGHMARHLLQILIQGFEECHMNMDKMCEHKFLVRPVTMPAGPRLKLDPQSKTIVLECTGGELDLELPDEYSMENATLWTLARNISPHVAQVPSRYFILLVAGRYIKFNGEVYVLTEKGYILRQDVTSIKFTRLIEASKIAHTILASGKDPDRLTRTVTDNPVTVRLGGKFSVLTAAYIDQKGFGQYVTGESPDSAYVCFDNRSVSFFEQLAQRSRKLDLYPWLMRYTNVERLSQYLFSSFVEVRAAAAAAIGGSK